jgi:hypothetical protein
MLNNSITNSKGDIPKKADELVEKDFDLEDSCGFSIPHILSDEEVSEADILTYAGQYLQSEVNYHEHRTKSIRINPIFNGRDFFVDPNLCFVLMPFGMVWHLQEVYTDNIKPIIESQGFVCHRADDIYDTSPIVETVWENINKARLIIAELTGKNPNVFYELGIAHTVGKEVILLSQNIEDVPFDLRHLRVILYDVTPRGINNLEKQLAATISSIKARNYQCD